MSKDIETVLVTGVTGFLGSHTAIHLLNRGYRVVGTLRDMNRAAAIRAVLGPHSAHMDRLELREADLNEANWATVLAGVDYVQHVASPFPQRLPRSESDLIEPAVNGTLNVLKGAVAAGVKRVVMTSSVVAVSYGRDPEELAGHRFTEQDWTNVENRRDTTPYFRSKTLAERTAWDFMATHAPQLELVTVCPGAILGPVLEQDFGTSANIVLKTLNGSAPALPNIGFEIVDVRSVAELLVLAMEKEAAKGKRYIASAGYMRFKDVAETLREAYPQRKIPRIVLPDWFTRVFSYIDPTLKPILPDLGVRRHVDIHRAQEELGWTPLSKEEAVLACARSLLSLGIVK